MNILTKRDKILLGLLIVILIFFVYFKLLLLPSLNSISDIKSSINTNQVKLSDLESKKTESTAIKNYLAKNLQKYETAKNEITTDLDDRDIVSELSKVCAQDNIKLTNLTFSTGSIYANSNTTSSTSSNSNTGSETSSNNKISKGQLMTAEASISVSGGLSDIIKFIDNLEHTDRIAIISMVSLSQSDGTIKASITANYFYFQGKDQNTAVK